MSWYIARRPEYIFETVHEARHYRDYMVDVWEKIDNDPPDVRLLYTRRPWNSVMPADEQGDWPLPAKPPLRLVSTRESVD